MPIVLTITPDALGSYSVSQDGQHVASGRRAMTSALFNLRMAGAWDDVVVVRNAVTGQESAPFHLRDYHDITGVLPLPESKRELARRRREEGLRGLPSDPVYPSTAKPDLPPLRGRSGVWIDQRAR